MNEELQYLISRVIGIIICIGIDAYLSYRVGSYFHSLAIGLTVWFALGRLLSIQDSTKELKRDRGIK